MIATDTPEKEELMKKSSKKSKISELETGEKQTRPTSQKQCVEPDTAVRQTGKILKSV